MRRLFAGLATTAFLLCIPASEALAGEVRSYSRMVFDGHWGSVEEEVLEYRGRADAPDTPTIEIDPARARAVVAEGGSRMSVLGGCELIAGSGALCTPQGTKRNFDTVDVVTMTGNDQVTLSAETARSPQATHLLADMGGGNDTVNVMGGNWAVDLGWGNDVFRATPVMGSASAFSVVNGGDGNDKLNGTTGGDFFRGGNGADTLSPHTAEDTVVGDGGNDVLNLRDGVRDFFVCGTGWDRVVADPQDYHQTYGEPESACERVEVLRVSG